MERCRAKRGFFSLRDCGEMSVKQCALCGRPMCSHHLSPMSGFTRCLDCEGRSAEKDVVAQKSQPQSQAQKTPPPAPDQPLTDPSWPYRYRNRYYDRGYAPIYTGVYYDSYYDRYDTRSFDSSMASRGPSYTTDPHRDTGSGDS
jgi:hypothetical protein